MNVVVKHPELCFEHKDFFYPIHLPDGNLIELLRNEVPLWDAQHPVVLDVPTGQGKTTFIYEVLLPTVIASGGNMLILSNRLALSLQQKRDIMRITCDDRINIFTSEGIRRLEDFGPVRVLTYHRLPALLNDSSAQRWLANVKYVVFDEFHFFCADSVFNEKCDYLLKLATSKFCKAIRIYMSATTEDVLDPLAKAELNNYHRICYPYPSRPLLPAYHYYRHADYDGYDLRFFDDLDELCPEIENDASVRWLIFVSSKEDGKNLAAKLGTNAYYIDAAKKEGPVWDKLMDDHCFDTQVLISTPVLDCGFNLIDDTLTNVVIATDNKTSFMQMLGRKRRTNDAPVTVWVQDISKRTIAARHNQFQNILRWYKDFDRCRTPEQRLKFAANLWRSYDPSIQKLFRLTVNDLYLNELARYTIKRRALFYSQLLSGSITFQEEVRRWLGHSLVPRQDSNVVLEQFYLEHEGVPLSEQEQNQLRQLIVQLSEQQGFSEPQKKRCDSLGERALNNRLNNIAAPFKIFTTDDSHWLLKRI